MNWSILPAPEDSVLVHRLEVDLGGLVQSAEAGGPTRVGDVQRCHDDVKVLGVDDHNKERHDHDDVQVYEGGFDDSVGRCTERRQCPSETREAKAHQP